MRRFFAWLEKRSYKDHVRVLLARYRSYDPCPACGGTRFRPETLRFRLHGLPLPELTARSIEELRRWLAAESFENGERGRAGEFLEQLERRLEVLHRVGLDYPTLDRQARTLSGGDGVVVVEHNLDLVARGDWILELGPGGGTHGGRLLFNGPLEDFLENGDGPTAEALRGHLKL